MLRFAVRGPISTPSGRKTMPTGWELAISGVISIAVAYIAYRAAVHKHVKTTKDSDKDIYVTAITNERARWRDDLRRAVARFCSQSVEARPSIAALQELRTEIVLRLNPNALDPHFSEKHQLDREIASEVDSIFETVLESSTKVPFARLRALERSTQRLLKQEWEVSKREALLGQAQGADDVVSKLNELHRLRVTTAHSANTHVPLPIASGLIALAVALLAPVGIRGWFAFLIGFSIGVLLLFIAGYL
jgi:hypothetical protein